MASLTKVNKSMKLKFIVAPVAMLAVGVLLAGCAGGAGTTEPTSSSVVDGDLAAMAAEKVAEFSTVPASFPGPTEAFDPGTGTAAVMSCGFAAEVCKVNGDLAVEAFQAMGWEVAPNFDGEFSPAVQAGFIDRAVEQGLDGIVLSSVDVNTIQESVERAAAAGLFIACVMCASGEVWEGKVYDVTVNWEEQGAQTAWAIIHNSGPEAKVVGFQDNAFTSTVLRSKGLEETLAANCPSCTFQRELFATGDIVKPGPPQITALLASKPAGEITNIVLHYDGLGMAAAKTVFDSGRDDITLSGYDADSVAANAIITGEPAPYGWSVAGPYNYEMWAAVDLVARNKAGLELWPDRDQMPSVLIDSSNAELYTSATPGPENYKQFFLDMWGK